MRVLNFLVILFFLSSIKIFAQDVHFSQFYHTPMAINPANTGVFPGDYRFTSNYKNQWQTITNPYTTLFASFELSLPVKRVSIGLSAFNDKAGTSQMGVTQGNLSASYNLRLDGSNSFITGLQYGFGQSSINTTNLKWDSQYNGVFHDPTLPSGETQLRGSHTYMDVSAGVLWNYTNNFNQFKNSLGVAIFHANKPKQSFFGNTNSTLAPKIVAHISSQIKMDKQKFILPQLIYIMQGAHMEISTGALFKYIIGYDNASDLVYTDRFTSSALYLGAQYRLKDAIVASAAYEIKKSLLIGISYDINISRLRTASELRGGMEVALKYHGAFN